MSDTYKKALERLVKALSDKELDLSGDVVARIELLEEALSYAVIALGKPRIDHEELLERLDNLAVQLVMDRMSRMDLYVYHVKVSDEDDEPMFSLFSTFDDKLATDINACIQHKVDQTAAKEKPAPVSVKKDKEPDYSIN